MGKEKQNEFLVFSSKKMSSCKWPVGKVFSMNLLIHWRGGGGGGNKIDIYHLGHHKALKMSCSIYWETKNR